MLLARLVAASDEVRRSPARRAKQATLAALLRELPEEEIETGVAFLAGRIPQRKLGAAQALVSEIAEPPANKGSLTLSDVDRAFAEVAGASGSGATSRRRQVLAALFGRATADEQDFLRRLMLNELRQGALESVMLDAVADAFGVPLEDVRRAAMYAGGAGAVARAALGGGVTALALFDLQLLTPVSPMLAQPADTVDEALEALGEAAFEWKLDGARIQVHKSGNHLRIYTRALNDVTAALPDVVATVAAFPAQELILDGEAIVLDDAGRPRPFQVTMRRLGRRVKVDELRLELPITPSFFDILQRDGTNLVALPAVTRHAVLEDVVPAALRTPRLVTADAAEARTFLDAALAQGHEGVMAKSLQSTYDAGNRGGHWLKIKQPKSLDLVVLGAEWGSGRRKGWLSNLHLGARDPVTGQYVMLGKTFKGLTDETLAWQTRELLARETHRDGATVYVRPELVVEIAFSDLQASPHYPGGLALRFARVKAYRPDKAVWEADTLPIVRSMAGLT